MFHTSWSEGDHPSRAEYETLQASLKEGRAAQKEAREQEQEARDREREERKAREKELKKAHRETRRAEQAVKARDKEEARAQEKLAKARQKERTESEDRHESITSSGSSGNNSDASQNYQQRQTFLNTIKHKFSRASLKDTIRENDMYHSTKSSPSPGLETEEGYLKSSFQNIASPHESRHPDGSTSSQFEGSISENESSRASSGQGDINSLYAAVPLQLPPQHLTAPGNFQDYLEPQSTLESSIGTGARKELRTLECSKLLEKLKSRTPGQPGLSYGKVTANIGGKTRDLLTVNQVTDVKYSPYEPIRDASGEIIGLGFEPVSSRVSPVPTISEEDEENEGVEVEPYRPNDSANVEVDGEHLVGPTTPKRPVNLEKYRSAPKPTHDDLETLPAVAWNPPIDWQVTSSSSSNTPEVETPAPEGSLDTSDGLMMALSVQQPQRNPTISLTSTKLERSPSTKSNNSEDSRLHRMVQRMDRSSTKSVLNALKAVPSPRKDAAWYRNMELEKQVWIHMGVDHLASHYNGVGKHERRQFLSLPTTGPSKVLSLHESRGTAAFLIATTAADEVHHLAQDPIDPNSFKKGLVLPFTVPNTNQRLTHRENSYSVIQCMSLPILAPSHEISKILLDCHRMLLPTGQLNLTIMDAMPIAHTTGPRMNAWLQENLLVKLQLYSRAYKPSQMTPYWLQEAGFVVNPKNSISLALPAAINANKTPLSEIEELSVVICRCFWKLIWGTFIAADKWWWQDRRILEECKFLKTRWEFHAFSCSKEATSGDFEDIIEEEEEDDEADVVSYAQ